MSMVEPTYLLKNCIMEGYSLYLINYERIPTKARVYVNLVRMFHNYTGKSYIDIEKEDIFNYLIYLGKDEHLHDRSLIRHMTAIKKFYEYLWQRGDIAKSPTEGVTIKQLEMFRMRHKKRTRLFVSGKPDSDARLSGLSDRK